MYANMSLNAIERDKEVRLQLYHGKRTRTTLMSLLSTMTRCGTTRDAQHTYYRCWDELRMLDIGLVGTGGIGSRVAKSVTDGMVTDARITCVHNRTRKRARALVDSLDADTEIQVVSDPLRVAERSDVVVEAANQTVIEESAVDILATGTDLVAMSVGAFRDPDLLREIRRVGVENRAMVHVPSGSIGGLDALGAIGNASLDAIALYCYRPPEYMGPYVDDPVNLDSLNEGEVVFEGDATTAAEAFPSHMNVAIAVALTARVDPETVSVTIEVAHSAPRARYVVYADGSGGTIEAEILNFRTETEPETGTINVLSIVETLRRISDCVVVGT